MRRRHRIERKEYSGTFIQPTHDRILIQRLEEPQGRIIVTDADKSLRGKVLAVGPGRRDEDGEIIPVDVQVGDLVLFNSRWHDLGDDYQEHQWWDDPTVHLVQEGDV